MTVLELSRWQFGITTVCHFIRIRSGGTYQRLWEASR